MYYIFRNIKLKKKVSPYCATVLGVSTDDANVNQVMECQAIHDKLMFGSSLKVKLVIIKLDTKLCEHFGV